MAVFIMFWVLLLVLPLNVYSQEECGVPTPVGQHRILVGAKAPLGSFPWAASLMYCLKHQMPFCQEPLNYGNCAGTLINNRQVLTAAHCVRHDSTFQYSEVAVILGAVKLNDTLSNGVAYIISDILVHPHFETQKPFSNDIALLTLRDVVAFTDVIKPICLPTLPHLVINNFVGYHPLVAGWGLTKTLVHGKTVFRRSQDLLYQQIRVVDPVKCQRYLHYVLPPSQICAGGKGKSPCPGDSGTGLVLPYLGRYYIIGIVSGGIPCEKNGKPSSFTRITSYIGWITNNCTVVPR